MNGAPLRSRLYALSEPDSVPGGRLSDNVTGEHMEPKGRQLTQAAD
jgi:hypothetical protein